MSDILSVYRPEEMHYGDEMKMILQFIIKIQTPVKLNAIKTNTPDRESLYNMDKSQAYIDNETHFI